MAFIPENIGEKKQKKERRLFFKQVEKAKKFSHTQAQMKNVVL